MSAAAAMFRIAVANLGAGLLCSGCYEEIRNDWIAFGTQTRREPATAVATWLPARARDSRMALRDLRLSNPHFLNNMLDR